MNAEAAVAAAESENVESLKVEQGKDHAVVVEDATTPVLPDSETFPKRAYQLQWEIDVPLFAIGAALAMGRTIRSTNSSAPAYCTTVPEGCDEDDLNAVDKPFAGNYDESWSEATDWIVRGLFVAPLPMLWIDNTFLNVLNDVTIICDESGLTALALSGLATMSAQRARPFVYGTNAPEAVRTSPNGALSFVSGHTTMPSRFPRRPSGPSTAGTARAFMRGRLGGGNGRSHRGGGRRVAAGKHFPTDVVTGAAVGAVGGHADARAARHTGGRCPDRRQGGSWHLALDLTLMLASWQASCNYGTRECTAPNHELKAARGRAAKRPWQVPGSDGRTCSGACIWR